MEKTWKPRISCFSHLTVVPQVAFRFKTSMKRDVYVQFESLKRGYIDDVEFLVTLGTDFRKTLWDSADLAAAVGFLIV